MASTPARIERVVRDYRTRLADLEAAYTRAVGPARAEAARRLRQAALEAINALRAEMPEGASRRWVTNHPAYRELLAGAAADLDRITVEAVRAIQWQVAAAAAMGPESVTRLAVATLGASASDDALLAAFGRVPTGAIQQLVGQLQASSPLASLPGLNQQAIDTMGRELVRGLTNGTNSRVIARQIARTSTIPASRAATIARTETHRAYREAARLGMQSNPLVSEWVWHASLSPRTCSSCWAMHGEVFDTDEPMGSHPNCRCMMLPKVTPPAWMDAPDVAYASGEAEFAKLDAELQRMILGPAKHDAYQRGEITLRDTVRVRESDEWGTTRSVASLTEARAAAS